MLTPTMMITKHLTQSDIINLMWLPTGRDLITVDTHMGFDTVYGFMLYALGELRLYWVPGDISESFVVVRHLTGVNVQLATASTVADAADVFNAAAMNRDPLHWNF